VEVIPPGGPASPPLDEVPGSGFRWKRNDGVLCQVTYCLEPEPTARGRFVVAIPPTSFHDVPTRKLAPSGTWIVRLTNLSLESDDLVQAWIQRDDTPYGYPRRGRQSHFDHPCYVRYDRAGRPVEEDDPDCAIRRAGSINAIATGRETIVIGGLLRKELRPPPY
jgi:hypothetical protein